MYDLNDEATLNFLVNNLVSEDQDRYRLELDRQWRVLRGDLKDQVKKELAVLYPKTYKNFIVSEMNLARKVTDKRAKSYKEAPSRILEVESETARYESFLSSMETTEQWRLYDEYYNYFKYAAMWFTFYEDNGVQVPVIRALRPSQFSRVVDSFGNTQVFAVFFGAQTDTHEQVRGDRFSLVQQDEPEDYEQFAIGLWTKDQHQIVEIEKTRNSKKLKRILMSENEEGTNDLGVIPAVFSQEGDNRERPAFNSLSSQTIDLNVIYSIILSGMSVQTFGNLVLKHPQDQKTPDIMQQGIFTYIPLPQAGEGEPETTADYITPSPNIADSLEVFREYLSATLKEHGVTGEMKEGSFASGLDRLLSQMDTTEIVELNQQEYFKREKGLYEIIKEFARLTGFAVFSSESIDVRYKKPKPLQSEKEILEIIKTKLELGLIEKHEALLALNPNMSEDSARAKIELIDSNTQVDNGEEPERAKIELIDSNTQVDNGEEPEKDNQI